MSVYTTHSSTPTRWQAAIAVLAALITFALGYTAAYLYLNVVTRASEDLTSLQPLPVALDPAAAWTAGVE